MLWEPLKYEERNGIIDYYKLSYNDGGKHEVKYITAVSEKSRIVIENLQKYKQYNFSIEAHNDKGFGPKLIVGNMTHEDGKCIKYLFYIIKLKLAAELYFSPFSG